MLGAWGGFLVISRALSGTVVQRERLYSAHVRSTMSIRRASSRDAPATSRERGDLPPLLARPPMHTLAPAGAALPPALVLMVRYAINHDVVYFFIDVPLSEFKAHVDVDAWVKNEFSDITDFMNPALLDNLGLPTVVRARVGSMTTEQVLKLIPRAGEFSGKAGSSWRSLLMLQPDDVSTRLSLPVR